MTWITTGKAPAVSHPEILVMLHRAVAAAPDDVRRQRALARELFGLGDYRQAIDAFERLLLLAGDLGEDWPSLGMAMLDIDGADAVLDLCGRRWQGAGTVDWHQVNAQALWRCSRIEDAHTDFCQAIALGDPEDRALRSLLTMYADRGDGTRLLDACELFRDARCIGTVRGYRALALSLLGRDEEARALVDLDAGTMQFRFVPPPGTTLETFNDALANAILADQPRGTDGHDILLNHDLHLPDSAELAALRTFVGASYAAYVARFDEQRGTRFLPAIAGATTLDFGAVTVRRKGRNGQHVHPGSYLTGVYHVRVPPVAAPMAGALVTGVCDEIAPGHCASWGTRVLPAIPGTLTIFPAHYFHDVRPTEVEPQRVVVVSDLMPA